VGKQLHHGANIIFCTFCSISQNFCQRRLQVSTKLSMNEEGRRLQLCVWRGGCLQSHRKCTR